MEFFDAFPPAGGPRPPVGRQGKPAYEVPASAPGEAVLVRTGQVAVWIGAVRAYSNGFEFTLRAVRTEPSGSSPLVVRPFPPADLFTTVDRDGLLRVGIQYADGRRGAISPWVRPRPPVPGARADDPEAVLLMQSLGGGDLLTWDANFWVSPLPPAGPVVFYGSWLDAGAGEQRAEFDGTAIRAAGGRAVRLAAEGGPASGAGPRGAAAPDPPDGDGPRGDLGIPGPRPPTE